VSLRTSLILAAAYVLTVVVVALEAPLWVNIARRAEAEFESVALSNAAILASQVSDTVARISDVPGEPRPDSQLDRIVDDRAEPLGARILVTDAAGRVLSDSADEARFRELYATAQRPEFEAGLDGGRIDVRRRFSEELDQDLLLVTVPVVDREVERSRVVGAVRVSEPLTGVTARVRRSWLGLGLIGAAVIVAGLLLAWVLATWLVRPVRRLEGAAVRLGRGDLSTRATPEGPSELTTLAESFNRMAETLVANIDAQRDFVANASHQLRTPLTGLRLRLEAIEAHGGEAGEEARKAETEVDRLALLVEDLLRLARASSAEVTASRIDVTPIARSAVERWADAARAAGKDLALHDGEGAQAWADAGSLAYVLDNLIDNALRYSSEGARVSVHVRSTGDGAATVAVSDTGPGIPEEEREHIFQRFYRGSQGRRSGPGSGLGLPIVAELVRRWGGDVRALEGPGTTIEISLRARKVDPDSASDT
jgi:two-component system, OmpR family, sensor kinase